MAIKRDTVPYTEWGQGEELRSGHPVQYLNNRSHEQNLHLTSQAEVIA
jgi:hypothetical protein